MLQLMLFPDNLPRPRWANPPWTPSSPPWLELDRELPPDDRARLIDRLVAELDLTPLRQAYAGTGSAAHPPELLLRLVLFEIDRGRLRPAQWHKDCCQDGAVKWLLFGLKPSRSCLYQFRDRIGPSLELWISQVLGTAKAEGLTTGQRASVDGTFEPSRASRHTLVNDRTLEARCQQLDAAIAADFAVKSMAGLNSTSAPVSTPVGEIRSTPEATISPAVADFRPAVALSNPADPPSAAVPCSGCGEPTPAVPAQSAQPTAGDSSCSLPRWMGQNPATRIRQRHRYRQAQQHMEQRKRHRQETQALQAKAKRRTLEQIKISPSDPEAPLGFDKIKVFCPLYNVQLVCDLDSTLVLGYGVYPAVTDANLLGPALERTRDLSGAMPATILNDNQYANIMNLKFCHDHGVTMYSPMADGPPGKKSPPKQIPKREFTWLPEQQTYRCPEGHLLVLQRQEIQHRQGAQELIEYQYRCPGEHCQICPRQSQCTRTPQKGRIIKRSQYDELWDDLRERMRADQSQAVYKLRKQTVERQIADLKEHRGLRRFTCYGLNRARIQVGLLILAHNGLALLKARSQRQRNAHPSLQAG
jgi:transposase